MEVSVTFLIVAALRILDKPLGHHLVHDLLAGGGPDVPGHLGPAAEVARVVAVPTTHPTDALAVHQHVVLGVLGGARRHLDDLDGAHWASAISTAGPCSPPSLVAFLTALAMTDWGSMSAASRAGTSLAMRSV